MYTILRTRQFHFADTNLHFILIFSSGEKKKKVLRSERFRRWGRVVSAVDDDDRAKSFIWINLPRCYFMNLYLDRRLPQNDAKASRYATRENEHMIDVKHKQNNTREYKLCSSHHRCFFCLFSAWIFLHFISFRFSA